MQIVIHIGRIKTFGGLKSFDVFSAVMDVEDTEGDDVHDTTIQ